ncbi:MAG: hypothetical protein LJF06_00135 [Gemmatimonadetes bacterium]|nr:hypothetical protein [Gemmatimonadota bacterium]
MFMYGPFDILILAVAIAIVIKPIARAAGEFARSRSSDRDRDLHRAVGDAGRERIEALEERVRLLEERQDFTEKLVSGRRDEPRLPTGPAAGAAETPPEDPPQPGEKPPGA